jgi:hypothetical protein
MRRWLADLLTAIALRLYPAAAAFPDFDAVMDGQQWAALMVLHAEGVHGCEHTDQVRRELGIVGPRGKAVEA